MLGSRSKLYILSLVFIIGIAMLTLYFHQKPQNGETSANAYKPGVKQDVDQAVNQAQVVYEQYKSLGTDFSSGPCLSNALLPGWVLDIAHNPRLPMDDLPDNQCSAFKEGKAKHFIELDPNGKLIKVK